MILPDNQSTHSQAAAVIKAGGVIAFRTDTFYGLGADPFNPRAVQRINEIKGREGKPILIVISDRNEVSRFITNQSRAFTLAADMFWPGPLTLIGPTVDVLPEELTAGTGTIGLRLPDDDLLRAFVRLCGGALTATSANVSGSPPARSAEEVRGYFSGKVDLIIDGGTTEASNASTVVDVTGPQPRVVREGMISRLNLERVLGQVLSP